MLTDNPDQDLVQQDVVTFIRLVSHNQFLHPLDWPEGARDATVLIMEILKHTPVEDYR